MRDEQHLSIIQFAYLHDLQQQFQREISELIDIYLHDARRKLANLHKALHDLNYTNFLGAIRELRLRSIDVGAIRFSYYCLQLEIAVQEMRLESVQKLIHFLEETFETVVKAL
ncbi:MAG: hypothetical protein AB7V32_05485, partial [Candidatus Berkiella sp.]